MILKHFDRHDTPLAGVVSYGAGNIGNALRALSLLGVRHVLLESPDDISETPSILIVPGVGAFRPAARRLEELRWPGAIRRWAAEGRPVLGICIGMQLLCESSDEEEVTDGIGLLRAKVRRLSGLAKTPHMGWNNLEWQERAESFALHADTGQDFYFVHSYAPETGSPDCIAVTAVDGVRFASVMKNGSVAGFQFHPERSGPKGIDFLGRVIRSMIEDEKIPASR